MTVSNVTIHKVPCFRQNPQAWDFITKVKSHPGQQIIISTDTSAQFSRFLKKVEKHEPHCKVKKTPFEFYSLFKSNQKIIFIVLHSYEYNRIASAIIKAADSMNTTINNKGEFLETISQISNDPGIFFSFLDKKLPCKAPV